MTKEKKLVVWLVIGLAAGMFIMIKPTENYQTCVGKVQRASMHQKWACEEKASWGWKW